MQGVKAREDDSHSERRQTSTPAYAAVCNNCQGGALAILSSSSASESPSRPLHDFELGEVRGDGRANGNGHAPRAAGRAEQEEERVERGEMRRSVGAVG